MHKRAQPKYFQESQVLCQRVAKNYMSCSLATPGHMVSTFGGEPDCVEAATMYRHNVRISLI